MHQKGTVTSNIGQKNLKAVCMSHLAASLPLPLAAASAAGFAGLGPPGLAASAPLLLLPPGAPAEATDAAVLLPSCGEHVEAAAASVARLKLVLREKQASTDGRRGSGSRAALRAWASGAFPVLAARPRRAAAAAACRRFSGVSSLCSLSQASESFDRLEPLKVQSHLHCYRYPLY